MLSVHGEVVSAFSRWTKQDLGNLPLQILIGWSGYRIKTDGELRKKELLKSFVSEVWERLPDRTSVPP
jgi:hypothetical protein